MKTTQILILIAFSFSVILKAQTTGSCTYTLRVNDNKLKPLANIPVTFIETSTKERVSKNTDAQGMVIFVFTTGKEWAMNILEMKNCRYIDVPERGKSSGSGGVTYDPVHYERQHRPLTDRSNLNFTTIDQTTLRNPAYAATEAAIRLSLVKEDKTPLANYPVNLTCYKTGKTFSGKTNFQGFAFFLVDCNNDYEVDIDGIESFNYVDVANTGQYSLAFTYQPTNITETEVRDTVTQIIPKDSKGTSSRIYLKLQAKGNDGKVLANEDVYLQMLKTNKVYKAKTNSEGYAYFLLPVKRKYMVHFRFEKDVDVLNYSDVQGIGSAAIALNYRPDPRLQFPERYIPTPENLMIQEFSEFLTKQFPEPKNDEAIGLSLSWGNEKVNKESKEAALQMGFKVKNDSRNIYGPPLNISLVIDRSGSMEGHDRIEALKKALLKYVSKLRKTDIVSVVAFASESQIIVPAQVVGDGSYLRDMIEDIQTQGGTDIYKGMIQGYELVLKNFLPKGTNRVLLLTDGYDSRPVEELLNKSKEYNAKGVELSAIGVGSDYNKSLLTLLATAGGGLLNFAGEAKDIDKVFEKELSSILSPVAKNVRIEIIYNEKIVFKQLYGFPIEKKENNKVEMKLDNIYSGLNTLALVKFDLTQPDSTIEKSPVTVRMTYLDLKKQKEFTLEQKAFLKWSPSGEIELILEAEHKKLYAIAIMNQSLKVMAEAFAKNDTKSAITAVQSASGQVKKLYPQSTDADVDKLLTAMQTYLVSLKRFSVNKTGK